MRIRGLKDAFLFYCIEPLVDSETNKTEGLVISRVVGGYFQIKMRLELANVEATEKAWKALTEWSQKQSQKASIRLLVFSYLYGTDDISLIVSTEEWLRDVEGFIKRVAQMIAKHLE